MSLSFGLSVNEKGHLAIGGADTVELANKYSTPIFVMDEFSIRKTLRELKKSMQDNYGEHFCVAYACKAFCCKEMIRIVKDEGCCIDVVSQGELFTALSVDFPPQRIFFHGSNKSKTELSYAAEHNVGRIVADNFGELEMLSELAAKQNKTINVMLRVKPGIDAQTHSHIKTGQVDSKFGFALETGEAMGAARFVLAQKGLNLSGVHCHIGSQIFDIKPYQQAAKLMTGFIAQIKEETGFEIAELNLGGGFGIRYTDADKPQSLGAHIKAAAEAVHDCCTNLNIAVPKVIIEPGRSVVGPAGITLYTVGAIKNIPNVRTYVSVDGGMTDNPRYVLYNSIYDAVVANRAGQPRSERVTLAGKCCENGDLIGENMPIQKPMPGDILAVLSTGAYNYSMSSNYNRLIRPAVVMVNNGDDRLIVRRESIDELVRCDI
jgi:diaminopimelate decarboxylase